MIIRFCDMCGKAIELYEDTGTITIRGNLPLESTNGELCERCYKQVYNKMQEGKGKARKWKGADENA